MDINDGQFVTLKEYDAKLNAPKGTAFKMFKACLQHLIEDTDFVVLNATEHDQEIALLKSSKRVYTSTVNAVLIFDSGMQKIRNFNSTP